MNGKRTVETVPISYRLDTDFASVLDSEMPLYRSDAPDVAPSFRQRFEEDNALTAAMLTPKAETSELGGVLRGNQHGPLNAMLGSNESCEEGQGSYATINKSSRVAPRMPGT